MYKRTIQGVATVATLGTGIMLGTMMLGPTSAAPLVDQPDSEHSSATATLGQNEGVVVLDGTFAEGCEVAVPRTGVQEGSNLENPGVFTDSAVAGPSFELSSAGVSVTVDSGMVVVTDQDGTVLLETAAGDNEVTGTGMVAGDIQEIAGSDLASLANLELHATAPAAEECGAAE